MSLLQHKPDWERSKARFEAFWHREVLDRPLVQAFSRRNNPLSSQSTPSEPESLDQFWLDADYRIDAFEANAARTHYGGDAFPIFETYIGPGSLALYLGSEPRFAEDTVWNEPSVDSLADSALPVYDATNETWLASYQMCRRGVERLRGKAIVSIPDLIEGLDTLASLRGTQELLFDLVEHPQAIHKWQRALVELYFEYYDRIYDVVKDDSGGSCASCFFLWAPGRMAKLQCDVSAMVSPAMFDEFAAPYLDEQSKRLDYVLYHLDGPHALQHVDTLLSLPQIDAVQWVPDPGDKHGGEEWMPLFRRIRGAGKSLHVINTSAEDAERIVRELGPEGLCFCIWVDTEQDADDLVRYSASWKKG